MKNRKLILAIGAAAAAVSLVFTGCASNSTSSDTSTSESSSSSVSQEGAAITDGYYTTSVSNLPCFLHFNEDGTYYASYFDGGVTDAGTYEVTDKELEYYETYNDGVADESSKKTAKQVVVLTSYVGGAVQEIAFDGDRLCDFTMGGMSNHAFMDHDASYDYVAEDMEPSIVVQTLYYNNDSGMTLTLYHDRSFVDYTGETRVSGSWAPAENGYTLTPESGEEWTLTIDGQNAVCVRGDEEQALTTSVVEGSVIASFTAAEAVPVTGVPGMDGPVDATVSLNVYDDNTAELIANIYDNDVIVDRGTCQIDTSGQVPAYAFTFENGGEVATEPDYTSATASSIVLNLNYTCTDAPCSAEIGGNAMDLSLSLEATLSFTYTLGG